jgi:hypothetical protein
MNYEIIQHKIVVIIPKGAAFDFRSDQYRGDFICPQRKKKEKEKEKEKKRKEKIPPFYTYLY